MQEENQDLLDSAILSIRHKVAPQTLPTKSYSTPPDEHRKIFNILEVWGQDTQDPDISSKVKYVYDFLSEEGGDVGDKIVGIMGEMPKLSNEPNIERVYKWCRLRDEYVRTTRKAEVLSQRMKQI